MARRCIHLSHRLKRVKALRYTDSTPYFQDQCLPKLGSELHTEDMQNLYPSMKSYGVYAEFDRVPSCTRQAPGLTDDAFTMPQTISLLEVSKRVVWRSCRLRDNCSIPTSSCIVKVHWSAVLITARPSRPTTSACWVEMLLMEAIPEPSALIVPTRTPRATAAMQHSRQSYRVPR